jgi:hypothetical protein
VGGQRSFEEALKKRTTKKSEESHITTSPNPRAFGVQKIGQENQSIQ